MSEKPLLLSSAKSPILVPDSFWNFSALFVFLRSGQWLTGWRLALVVGWAVFVLIGLFNIVGRIGVGVQGGSSSYLPSNQALAVGPAFSGFSGSSFSASTTSSSGGIIPARLQIPSIGVDAQVEEVGLNSDGSMGTPSSFGTVAWYKDGSKPGGQGSAVIDGHVNNALTSAGVFEHLDQVHLGDKILVADSSGRVFTFSIQSEQIYGLTNAPAAQIFSRTGPSQLVLITCDGAWDNGAKEFNERLVIYASLEQ